MKVLGVFICLGVVAFARPDVSHLSDGYNYNAPSTQPSGSYLPGNSGFTSGSNIASGIAPSGSYLPGDGNFGGSSVGSNAIQDQKHVFFYAAPDDEPAPRLRIQVASAGQKNTKLIFIKAPSYGAPVPEVINPPSQSEDKTLVYVLVKKQDQPGAINIPAGATVKQAKPEVYFIKYRNPQDAERSVQSSLAGQSAGSSLQPLGDQREFVSALSDPLRGQGGGFGDSFGSNLASGLSGGPSFGGSLGGGSLGSGSLGFVGNGLSGTKYGTPGESGPY